jgi:hypothetical protein
MPLRIATTFFAVLFTMMLLPSSQWSVDSRFSWVNPMLFTASCNKAHT